MEAVVSSARCPLYLRPSRQCQLADEALLGWTVSILDTPREGWYQVHTDYGYDGYVPAEYLAVGDQNARRWDGLDLRVVRRGICSVRSCPSVQGWELMQLLRGAFVAVHGQPNADGWLKVSLPDGTEGFTKEGFLAPLPTVSPDEMTLRKVLTDNARLYLDAHYVWGGKSPLGIDCSGLAFMAYRLAGVTIWRDASIQPDYPIHPIRAEDMMPGDLMYFPGHVAMYLGDHMYIHSTGHNGSDGVVINSMDEGHPLYRSQLLDTMNAVGSLF